MSNEEIKKAELRKSEENFSKTFFYIQVVSLIIAIVSIFLIK